MFQLDDNGQLSAPLSGSQIKEMAANGELFDDMKIRKFPDGSWQSVHEIKGVAIAERPLASPPGPESLQKVVEPQVSSPAAPAPASYAMPPQAPIPRPTPIGAVPMQAPEPKPVAAVANVPAVIEAEPVEVIDVEYVAAPAQLVECPFCSEDIKPTAKKCKHCGEILDVTMRDAYRPSHPPQPAGATTVVVNNQNVVSAPRYTPRHEPPPFSPGVAALLSFFFPGLGQLCKGQIANGIVWFFVVPLGYLAFVLPGLVLHLICVIGAASGDGRRNKGF